MPADHVLIAWAEQASHASGHSLGKWKQRGNTASAVCEKCGRTAIADFSREAADREEEVRGDAITDECDNSQTRSTIGVPG